MNASGKGCHMMCTLKELKDVLGVESGLTGLGKTVHAVIIN